MVEELVDVGGHELHVRVDGPEDAPWIAFSNSILTDLHVWDAQVAALGGRFRTLRYDQRGHGHSPATGAKVSLRDLGGDLDALLRHFHIDRCTLVGLSMGVPTVLDAHSRAPSRTEALILCDGQAATVAGGAKGWARRIETAEQGGMSAAATDAVERWFAEDFRAAGRADRTLRTAADMSLDGFRGAASALQDYDYKHVLNDIDCPTLLIAGANDAALIPSVEALHAAIAGSRMVRIGGAGHLPNVEQPHEFNIAFLEFLGRESSRS